MDSASQRPPTVMDPTELSLGEMYAQALLDTLPSNDEAEAVAQELEELHSVLSSIPLADNLLSGWAMPVEQRTSLIHKLFAGRVSKRVEGFLSVLNHRNRMSLLSTCVRGFRKLLNRREGKIEVLLTTATPLDDSQREQISEEMTATLKGQAMLRLAVDESLVGGALLRIGDRVYDASIRSQLLKFREKMATRRIHLKMEK